MLAIENDGQASITVEYQPEFLLRKHRGKFDSPDEDEDDEDEDEDEENQFTKDQTMTYTDSEIVDMRKVEQCVIHSYSPFSYPPFTLFTSKAL